MLQVKDTKLKHRLIQQVKQIMLIGDLTIDDLKLDVPKTKTRKEILENLAGAWKDKQINALAYQNQMRDELETSYDSNNNI